MLRKNHSLSAKARAFAEQKPTLVDAPILSWLEVRLTSVGGLRQAGALQDLRNATCPLD